MSDIAAFAAIDTDQLTKILASAQNALFVTDFGGGIVFSNPAAHAMLGLTAGELAGRRLADFLVDEEARAAKRNLDICLVAADGRRIPVLVSLSTMRDGSGNATGLVCVAKDITERKRAEEELTYRNALLSAQQETSLDGILVVDDQGRILSFNRRFIELWGISQDVIESRSDERALNSVLAKLEDPKAFVARVDFLYSHSSETSQDEIRLLDGRTFERYSAPIAADGRYFGRIWYFRDVTDRKHAQEAQALRERDLIQREFVATVSHELRTPITAIKGFAETLLLGGLEDKANRRSFVETIESNADRLAKLVDNLLALSVLETGKRRMQLEDVELGTFIRDFAASMEPLTRRAGLSMSVDVPPSLRAQADPNQLSQVLQNLLDNAIKFSKPGGRIQVAGRLEGATAVISVHDAGIGISARDLPRVFDRFHRGTGRAREIKGTGLGLAIAKEIIELHGGRISVESREDDGTTFSFTLPAKSR